MYYITLDLEWNQAYAQKALAVQRQLSARLRGEVIQIGAVKLDKNMNICGSYQVIVKPRYYKKLHRHVSELTGITQEQMDAGVPLKEAAEKFKNWCGKDFAFLTWGPDDIPMLKENFHVNSIQSDWLDVTYDLQQIFNRQTDGASKQRSLEYAMEYFEIPQTLPAHDALNDAYFTAMVAQRLATPEGVKNYGERGEQFLFDKTYGDADIGQEGYESIEDILASREAAAGECPLCRAPLAVVGKMLHGRGHRYRTLCHCDRDGDLFLTLKVFPNHNGTFRLRRMITTADPGECEVYRKKLEDAAAKRRRRPRRRKKSGAKGEGAAATEG